MQTQPDPNILPSRDNLDHFDKSYLKKATTWFSPDVVLLTAPDGVRFVMKDWSSRPAFCRSTWCRLAAMREIKVYEKLRGMQGVPQLISKLGDHGFIMEWLDARPLPSRKMRDVLGVEFFDRLHEVMTEMHSRGVAHGDLRRRNILRALDGSPKLIDFETAVHANKSPGGGPLFKAISHVDDITLTKIRSRYFPESITEEDRRMLRDIPWHLRFGRYVRQDLYAPLTRKGRRKRAKKAAR